MLERYPLNGNWRFSQCYTDEMRASDFCHDDMQAVRLPHSCQEIGYNYIDEKSYQMICAYFRNIDIAHVQSPANKRFFLYFEAAGHEATILINGTEVAVHRGGYTPFRVEITDKLLYEQTNTLLIRLDTRENLNMPPFGNVIDFLTYGGLYREVYLEVSSQVLIENAYVHCNQILADEKEIICDILINGELPESCSLEYIIREKVSNYEIFRGSEKLSSTRCSSGETSSVMAVAIKETTQIQISESLSGLRLWSLDEPVQYELVLMLKRVDHQLLDETTVVFGIREAVFKKDGFYLNGEKILLVGLNRHQSFPYVGYAMPERVQKRDACLLKNELGLNSVRTSHYPQSRHFIDACDELGLLVFTEVPGWQHVGDSDWKNVACDNIREMIIENRNHPSIILWGVRINESQDDDEFYSRTNQLAHDYDPYRQTGGVRFLKKSSLLEDVYTYNDFSHTGSNAGIEPKNEVSSNREKAYLVSEYNGHMFPTKSYDDEQHRLEHALRHARVLSAIASLPEVAGGFGWCMADYNTHKDFGSGDRICYHGVMDMFRNSKLAANVYASQQDRPVLQVSSDMNIGDYPGGYIGDVFAFTNMDSVKLYKNDHFVKEYFPDRDLYPGLAHPPIRFDDFIGELLVTQEGYSVKDSQTLKDILYAVARYGQNSLPIRFKFKMAILILLKGLKMEEGTRLYYRYIGNWGDKITCYRFEGVRNGRIINVINRSPGTKVLFQIDVDTNELIEGDTYDVASVRITALDEHGNRLNYYMEPLELSVEGELELIGPEIISLKGGAGGTYVKSTGRNGPGKLLIKNRDQKIAIDISVSKA